MDRHHPAQAHALEQSAHNTEGEVAQPQTIGQPHQPDDVSSTAQTTDPVTVTQSLTDAEDQTPLLAWRSQAEQPHPKFERYIAVIIMATVLAIVFALLLKSWFSAIVIILAAIALMVNATRRPPVHAYGIFSSGVQIENHFYDYRELRAFSIVTGSDQFSLELAPSQRFLPRLSLHAEISVLEQADTILQQFLPREDRKPDLIDRFNRWLNF